MRHIANTAAGRLARNQQDLLDIAKKTSLITTEDMKHPICEIGFCDYGEVGLERMDDFVFFRTLLSIFKSRPSARLWDFVPDVPYTEKPVLIQSPQAYRMSFEEKAQFLREEFVRRPNMVGLKMELHNIDRTTDRNVSGQPSVSFIVYESSDNLGDASIPISIKVTYRTQF